MYAHYLVKLWIRQQAYVRAVPCRHL